MDRRDIVSGIIEFSELSSLRHLISHSKKLQGEIFKGFRPQTLSRRLIAYRLLQPKNLGDDSIYELLCDWWKFTHQELMDELSNNLEQNWDDLCKKWQEPRIKLAISLSDLADKDKWIERLPKEFGQIVKNKKNGKQFKGEPNPSTSQEIIKLRSKTENLEKRLFNAKKKIKSLNDIKKSLTAELGEERKKNKNLMSIHSVMVEKTQLLKNENYELTRQVKLLKREMNERLDELRVAEIDYLDLGNNAAERKSSASLLYDLLCAPEGMIINLNDRKSEWLDSEKLKLFWKRKGDQVIVNQRPADYILLNTSALLEDLLNDTGSKHR